MRTVSCGACGSFTASFRTSGSRQSRHPAKPWTEINEDVVDELTEEVDAAQSKFEDVVADAILSRLLETDLVTVGSS